MDTIGGMTALGWLGAIVVVLVSIGAIVATVRLSSANVSGVRRPVAMAVPQEYRFYSNVNPNADHPRWMRDRERSASSWRASSPAWTLGRSASP